MIRHPRASLCLLGLVVLIRAASAAAQAPPAPAATQPAGERTFPASVRGDLRLMMPPGWTAQNADPTPVAPGSPSTIRLNDAARAVEVLLTIIPAPQGVRDFNSPPRLRQLADMQGRRMLPMSKEAKLEIVDLKPFAPGAPVGVSYSLSDRDPKPGSWEHMTGVVLSVGDLLLNATILAHEKESPHRRAALDMLLNARQVAPSAPGSQPPATQPAPPAPATSPATSISPAPVAPPPPTTAASDAPAPVTGPLVVPGRFVAALPARDWAVLIDGAIDLQVLDDRVSPDGRSRQILAFDSHRGVTVSVYLEPAPQPDGDSKAAREFYLGRLRGSPMPMRDVKTTEQPPFAVLEYVVPDRNQKHVNLYLSREGVWVDVHLSSPLDLGNVADAVLEELKRSVRVDAATDGATTRP